MPGIFAWVSLLEDGAACDQDLGACAHDLRDSIVMDAAVNFNAEAEPVGLPNVRQQLNLLEGRVDKGLATEARIHAHDKDMVDQRENLIESMDRRGRVYDYSGLASVRCNQVKGTIEMDAGFLVDGDPISPGFGKCGDEVIRSLNHEMAIERNFRDFAKRGYDEGADGDVRDEMTIHHVHMENGGSPFDGGLDLRAEASEVSRKDRGS